MIIVIINDSEDSYFAEKMKVNLNSCYLMSYPDLRELNSFFEEPRNRQFTNIVIITNTIMYKIVDFRKICTLIANKFNRAEFHFGYISNF